MLFTVESGEKVKGLTEMAYPPNFQVLLHGGTAQK